MIKLQFIISPSKMLLLDLCFCPFSIFLGVSHYVCMINKCSGLALKQSRQTPSARACAGPQSRVPPARPLPALPVTRSSRRLLARLGTALLPADPPLHPPVSHAHRCSGRRETSQPSAPWAVVQHNAPSRRCARRFGAENQCFGICFSNPAGAEEATAQPLPQAQTSLLPHSPDGLSAGSKRGGKLGLIFHSHLKNSAARCCYCA